LSQVRVPISLLLDQQLTAADKLVWMTMRLDKRDKHIRKLTSPTRLARRTGLSRVTIYNSFERLTSAEWVMAEKPIIKPKTQSICYVNMPAKLLTSKELKSRDKVMYGVLQATQFFSGKKGKIKYLELSKYAHMCVKTVRRAVKALAGANWINTRQVNQLAPIYYKLDDPQLAYCRQKCAKIQRQLDVEDNYGETICREMVLLLVDPAEYTVHSRPSWLTNPDTGMIMEIDLFIEENNLAVEYQGEQHFNPTSFASQEEVEKQKIRDSIKAKIVKARGINLVQVRTEDLSVDKMAKKLQDFVALRNLSGLDMIVEFLDHVGLRYQRQEVERRLKAQKEAKAKQILTPTSACIG
jgi:hypothetical protein